MPHPYPVKQSLLQLTDHHPLLLLPTIMAYSQHRLTAPDSAGKHNIQANFAGDSQYKSSKSIVKKLLVTENNLAATATSTILDTSLSLKINGKDEVAPDSTYNVLGKLIDSVSNKPISGKTITVTTDGDSKVTDTTDRKGEFEVSLKAPDSSGKYDIQANFAGDSQYKSI